MTGMETGADLRSADRDTLIGIIIRQQAIVDQLENRIAQLEGRAKSRGVGRMPGLKSKTDRKPAAPWKPRKRRSQGFARVRMTPTQWVEHVVEECPDCGTQLSGGWTHYWGNATAQGVQDAVDHLPRIGGSGMAPDSIQRGSIGPRRPALDGSR